MARVSIGQAWDETKAMFAADRQRIVPVALTMLLLPAAFMVLVMGDESRVEASTMTPGQSLTVLACALVSLTGNLAVARLALSRSDSVAGAIGHGLRRMVPLIAAMMIVVLPFFLALFVLVVVFGTDGMGMVAENLSPTFQLAFLVLMLVALYVVMRLILSTVVTVAEPGGPLHILKRSWALTAGNVARIAGFVALLLVAALVVSIAVGAVAGALLLFGSGGVEPLTLTALFLGLVQGAIQAAIAVVYILMLVSLYRQANAG